MPLTDVEPLSDSPPRPSIEYDRTSPTITRRQFRIFLWLIFVNTLLFAFYVLTQNGSDVIRTWWASYQSRRQLQQQIQRQDALLQRAGAYTAPADEVIHEENPAEALKLLNSPNGYTVIDLTRGGGGGGGYGRRGGGGGGGLFGGGQNATVPWQLPVQKTEPPIVTELRSRFSNRTSEQLATIMLHALKNSRGEERLVWIIIDGEQSITNTNNQDAGYTLDTQRHLVAFMIQKTESLGFVPSIDVARHHVVLRPQTPDLQTTVTWTKTNPPQSGPVTVNAKGLFRFYAAQPDSKDPSHFTIDYAIDGQRNTLDGYLKDDDSIIFTPRAGQIISERPDGKIWHPLATRPTSP